MPAPKMTGTLDYQQSAEQVMTIQKLERDEWNGLCLRVTRYCSGMQAMLEVMSVELGCQIEVHRSPMIGMSYDPRSDVMEFLIGDLDHLIRAPRELYFDDAPLGSVALQIVDAEGVRQIVTLQYPPMLPSPGSTHDQA
jgi:hypothetical protein